MANYADGLSDLDLDPYVDAFVGSGNVAQFLTVRAPHTFHIVHADADGYVQSLEHVGRSTVRVNAGFFVFRRDIFDVMREGEELVIEPFERLMQQRRSDRGGLRRVLAEHGHVQGQGGTRCDRSRRRTALAGVEPLNRQPDVDQTRLSSPLNVAFRENSSRNACVPGDRR